MARKKYLALRENSETRLLLDGSICINKPCVPMFEVCSTCDFFQPDPKWREPLEEYIAVFEQKAQELEHIGGNTNTIAFLYAQKEVYGRILNKLNKRKEINPTELEVS